MSGRVERLLMGPRGRALCLRLVLDTVARAWPPLSWAPERPVTRRADRPPGSTAAPGGRGGRGGPGGGGRHRQRAGPAGRRLPPMSSRRSPAVLARAVARRQSVRLLCAACVPLLQRLEHGETSQDAHAADEHPVRPSPLPSDVGQGGNDRGGKKYPRQAHRPPRTIPRGHGRDRRAHLLRLRGHHRARPDGCSRGQPFHRLQRRRGRRSRLGPDEPAAATSPTTWGSDTRAETYRAAASSR